MPDTTTETDRLPANIWKVSVVAMLGSFLAQMDSTVVNVSLSSLVVDLHSTLSTMQWVTSGYLLTLALMMPLNGWLVDRIGAKRLYLWCFTLFTGASVLCGTAWSAESLIGFRILQGMAGGLLAPMAQMMLARAAGRHMARVIGYAAVPVLLGPILGPVIAGAILQHASWRWLFLVNLPFGVLAVALAVVFLPADDDLLQRRTFDMVGFATLAPALVLFLYGADHIRQHIGQALLVAGLLLMAVFARAALRKGDDALLDLKLFRGGGAFPTGARIQFLQNGIVYGTQMLLPLYLIRECGRSPQAVGLLLLPMGIGMIAAYPSMGALTKRFGIRGVAASGAALSFLSAIPFVFLAMHRSVGLLFAVALIVRGLGQGAVGVPSISAAYASVSRRELPMATTTLNIVQRLGGPTLTTLIAALLAWRLGPATTPAAATGAFVWAFVLICLLHAALFLSTLRLPLRLDPKPAESLSR